MQYISGDFNERIGMQKRSYCSFGIWSSLSAVLLAVWFFAGLVPLQAQEGERERAEAQRHRQELKEKLTALQAELKELEQSGKEDRAADVRLQVERIKRELVPQEPRPMKVLAGEPRKVRRIEREIVGEREPERAEIERRHQHLRVAVENLRAAGLPELAERVGQEGKRILTERSGGPGPMAIPGRPGPMMEQLRNELREMRESMKNLDRRIDELAQRAEAIRRRGPDEPRR